MRGIKNTISIFTLLGTSVFSSITGLNAKQNDPVSQMKNTVPMLMQQAGIPGLSTAYIENGKLVWQESFGLADTERQVKVTSDTAFEAASLSKPVLAYIVLKLVDRGQLSLDGKLDSLLPYQRFDQPDYAKQLTPRIILSHQSGLPNWGDTPLKFNRAPKEKFGYSGEGYVYLQKVLEKITGVDFQTLAEREVFKPLGMKNSRFTWAKNTQFPIAKGHSRASKQVSRDIPETNAASSLHTTAADYAKFLLAWMQFKGVSQKSAEVAFKPAIELALEDSKKNLPGTLGWGLGWGIQEINSQKIAWHWGDNGPFRAFTALDPDSRTAMVYFSNSQNGLAIAKRMTELSVGNADTIIGWLNYGQSDSALWQGMRSGYIAEENKNYAKAITEFEKVLEAFPDNNNVKFRLDWLKTLLKTKELAISLKLDDLKKIAGQYGPRTINLKDNSLFYSRSGGSEYRLSPLTHNLFAVGDLYEFRLEIVRDATGNAVKLIGHYVNGYKDESDRNVD